MHDNNFKRRHFDEKRAIRYLKNTRRTKIGKSEIKFEIWQIVPLKKIKSKHIDFTGDKTQIWKNI